MSNQILLIDDNVDLIETLSESLEIKGYSVLTATSAKQGIELYSKNYPCIVFMDVKMPEMDGYDAFKIIRKLDPNAKVVLVTGHQVKSKTSDAFLNGLLDILEKPVSTKTYVDIIKKNSCEI